MLMKSEAGQSLCCVCFLIVLEKLSSTHTHTIIHTHESHGMCDDTQNNVTGPDHTPALAHGVV